jgi:DNA-binding transcriptional LysR family regulator
VTKPFDFNLRHLRALAATCRCGSISLAAQQVNLSQPAVTQAIAKLEHSAGTMLLQRRSNGVTPTQAGRLLAGRVDCASAAIAGGFQSFGRTGHTNQAADRLVTTTQIRGLLALADTGSYVAAGRSTGLSQPSIHRAVRDLERLCSANLVERRGRGVAMTLDGLLLARTFRIARREIEAGLEELAVLAGRDSGKVTIGAMPLCRARLLPVTIAAFHSAHPGVSVEVVEGSHGELIDQLRDGHLDFLVGALRSPDPGPDVVQVRLFEDDLVVVARSGHPLCQFEDPGAGRLAAFPWVIAREGTPLHRHWRDMFLKSDVEPPAAPVACGSFMTIRRLLIESDFLTLLSPEQIHLEIRAGTLAQIGVPLDGTRRQIGLTTRANWYPSPAQASFLDALKSTGGHPRLRDTQ